MPPIAGLGAVVRGVTGFGPALVLVALASAFLPPSCLPKSITEVEAEQVE